MTREFIKFYILVFAIDGFLKSKPPIFLGMFFFTKTPRNSWDFSIFPYPINLRIPPSQRSAHQRFPTCTEFPVSPSPDATTWDRQMGSHGMKNFHFARIKWNEFGWIFMIIWGGNITWNGLKWRSFGFFEHHLKCWSNESWDLPFQVMSKKYLAKPGSKTPLGMEYGQLGPWGEYMCSICQWMCYMVGFCVEQHNFRKKLVDGTRFLYTQSSDLPNPRWASGQIWRNTLYPNSSNGQQKPPDVNNEHSHARAAARHGRDPHQNAKLAVIILAENFDWEPGDFRWKDWHCIAWWFNGWCHGTNIGINHDLPSSKLT